MAIIVDKVQKKKDIALACKDLFVQNSIKDLTISKIASTAGIGKGSLYDYFKNKEEIVFELINILMLEHDTKKREEIESIPLAKDKIKSFLDFFYKEEDFELREIFKDFVAISLTSPTNEIIAFQTFCLDNYFLWMQEIISDAILKKEIIEESNLMTKSIISTAKGFYISSVMTTSIENLENELNSYIDMLFTLMEKKNEN